MDTLHSDLREIVDHRDEVASFGPGTSGMRRFVAKSEGATSKVATTTAGAGWYHDAAIEAARHDAIDARANPYRH